MKQHKVVIELAREEALVLFSFHRSTRPRSCLLDYLSSTGEHPRGNVRCELQRPGHRCEGSRTGGSSSQEGDIAGETEIRERKIC